MIRFFLWASLVCPRTKSTIPPFLPPFVGLTRCHCSDEEAVKMVASASGEEDEKTIAKRIVDEAAKRGSNDNLTAIVVFF